MSSRRPPAAALDLRALLAILQQHAVDYTVIGGVAVQVHGHRRTTKGLDVVAGPDRQNLERLAAALVQLGARPRDVPGGAPTADHLTAAPIIPPLMTLHGELHILRDVPGAPAYGDLRDRALVVERGHRGSDRRPRRPHRDEAGQRPSRRRARLAALLASRETPND